jgi:hypothetical protein
MKITRRDLLRGIGGGALLTTSVGIGMKLFQQTAATQPGPCRDPSGYAECFRKWFWFFGRFARTPAALIAIIIGVGMGCYEVHCL